MSLPKGWSSVQLEQISKIERGRFSPRPRNDPKYYGGNYPFVQTGDIAAAGGRISSFRQTLNEEGIKVSKLFKPGTILMTIAANIGETAIATFDVACPDSLVGITPNEDTDVRWLNYFLQTKKSDLDAKSTKNAQKNINLETLKPLTILCPPYLEQKKIAEILSSWDKAIEVATENLTKVEIQKSQIMRTVFSTEYNEDCEVQTLSAIAKIRRGASPRPISNPDFFSERGRAWVRIADVTEQRKYLEKASQYLSPLGESKSVPVDPGQLIMSICATIGVPMIVSIPACIHDGFVLITEFSSSLETEYLYYLLASRTKLLASGGQPGTQKNLNTTIVGAIEVPIPTKLKQQKVISLLNSIDKVANSLDQKVLHLKHQKQGLMQKLLTGKVRVKV